MARATLIQDKEFTRVYKSASGELITLILDEEYTEILFYDKLGKQIGEFEFEELSNGDFKLTRMYTNSAKKGGIGRAALEFFKEASHSNIYTSPTDGIPRDDGSHLTGDALIFVNKMINEGLIKGFDNSIGNEFDDGFLSI